MGDQAGQQSGVALQESESPWCQCGTHLPGMALRTWMRTSHEGLDGVPVPSHRLLFTTRFNEPHQRYVIVTVTIAIASLLVIQPDLDTRHSAAPWKSVWRKPQQLGLRHHHLAVI
jgi:hypothetical protein